MRRRAWVVPVGVSVWALLMMGGSSGVAAQEGGEGGALGEVVYNKWCAGCHGVDGDGQGPGAHTMLPRPRDFTRAEYQIRTTAGGELPTDSDIRNIIDVGMPGTAMPGWEDVLSNGEREALVEYLKSFSRFFGTVPSPEPMDFGRAPRSSDERIAEGQEIYQQLECWQCHGQTGRGDGTSAPTLEDNSGFPIWAADLTQNWLMNGGSSVEDIYRGFRTGLDGTPMATFSDVIDAGIVTEDQMWSLAHYVRSLSPEDAPQVREVILAELVEDELPTTPDDSRWSEADRFYIPMVGQVVLSPRWFNPRVDALWVQAMHDGEELALLVSWTDPTSSPDPEWADFASSVRNALEPMDEGSTWVAGAPDRLVVQFPQTLPTGMERPFFLQGDARRPAYLWQWQSDAEGASELVARGLGTGATQAASNQQVEASAVHQDGEWRVLFRRSLVTPDESDDLQFPRATSVPISFQAWDGDNGEAGAQGGISTWYFVHLLDATPATVYVAPVLALLLTGLLGMVVVSRAQRREREGG